MTVKIMTSFPRLLQLAHELGQAKKSGDPEAIEQAKKAHDAYKELCLNADGMSLNCTQGSLM